METVIITIAILLPIAIISLYWGTVFSIRLPEADKFFDRKPFNCRPCLTFHITWVLSCISALGMGNVHVLVWGIITAFILFAILKIIDNKKITK